MRMTNILGFVPDTIVLYVLPGCNENACHRRHGMQAYELEKSQEHYLLTPDTACAVRVHSACCPTIRTCVIPGLSLYQQMTALDATIPHVTRLARELQASVVIWHVSHESDELQWQFAMTIWSQWSQTNCERPSIVHACIKHPGNIIDNSANLLHHLSIFQPTCSSLWSSLQCIQPP